MESRSDILQMYQEYLDQHQIQQQRLHNSDTQGKQWGKRSYEESQPNDDDYDKEAQQTRTGLYRKDRFGKGEESKPEKQKKTYYTASYDAEEEEANHAPQYATVQESDQSQHGYSSYVQHSDEMDNIENESNVDIQRLIPKSSVSVQVFHDEKEEQPASEYPRHVPAPTASVLVQQAIQKEASQAKLKNKPPKFIHDDLASFRRPTPVKVVPSGPQLVRDLTSTTIRPRHTPYFGQSNRKPFSARGESEKPKGSKDHENISGNHKGESSSFSSHVSFRGNNDDHGEMSRHRAHSWKQLDDAVEIAETVEVQPRKTRRPKEIDSDIFSIHSKYFDTEQKYKLPVNGNNFDHDKALKGSTSFGITNVVGLDGSETELKLPNLGENGFKPIQSFKAEDGFSFLQSIPKPQPEKVRQPHNFKFGSSKGPVQFDHTDQELVQRQKPVLLPSLTAHGTDIPVMTLEEFTKAFGPIPPEHEYKPQQTRYIAKPRPRLPYDSRAIAKKPAPAKVMTPQEFAMSFSSVNQGLPDWAKEHNQQNKLLKQEAEPSFPNIKAHPVHAFPTFKPYQTESERLSPKLKNHHAEIPKFSFPEPKFPTLKQHQPIQTLHQFNSFNQDGEQHIFPTFKSPVLRERNISLIPDKTTESSKGYTDDPNQFSVSASYKINRRSQKVH